MAVLRESPISCMNRYFDQQALNRLRDILIRVGTAECLILSQQIRTDPLTPAPTAPRSRPSLPELIWATVLLTVTHGLFHRLVTDILTV